MTKQNTSWPGRARPAARWGRRRLASGVGRHPRRTGWLASAAVVAASLIVAACASSSSNSGGAAPSPSSAATGAAFSGSALKTATINGIAVLTNAKGFTLYSFAPDTPATSRCNGRCATFWPPVKGPVTAGPGVAGSLGTIIRSDGATQATYNGHPLYTYIADTAPRPGQGQRPQRIRRDMARGDRVRGGRAVPVLWRWRLRVLTAPGLVLPPAPVLSTAASA